MPEDVPLDAFVGDGTEPDEADGAGQDGDGQGSDGPEAVPETTDPEGETAEDPRPVSPAAVEPARPTAGYDPAGRTCPRCGATVRRRWYPDTDTGTHTDTGTDSDAGPAPEGPLCRDCVSW